MHRWTDKTVAKQFEEAISTLRKLPAGRLQGYARVWPEIIHSRDEIALSEPLPLRLKATPDAITRMEQTFRWITWVEVEERKIIWHRAARHRWKTLCWEMGCDRSTAWRKWVLALTKIATRLNAG